MRASVLAAALLVSISVPAVAHDTWVETNTNIVRPGDAVYSSLMLGNHGNDHRDFKLAGKISLEKSTLEMIAPQQSYDLKPEIVDRGYAPREGFWSAKFVPGEPGLYCVAHQLDTLHNTTRAIKSAKTYFLVSELLDQVPGEAPGFERALGHPLEFVPTVNPVTTMGPEQPIAVQLLYQGEPLANARVTFIPRGATLSEGFDEQYERYTDAQGKAEFVPTEGNYVLVVAHHVEPEQTGENYDRTSYAATLTVYVPDRCRCCE